MHLCGPGRRRCEVFNEAVDIAGVFAGWIDTGGEVAIGALGAAKGDGDVKTQSLMVICGHRRYCFTRLRREQDLMGPATFCAVQELKQGDRA